MIRRAVFFFAALALALAGTAYAQAPAGATQWVEGKDYFRIDAPQPVTPGKVEVTEVFSYACPVCFRFLPFADRIAKSLPAGATMDYLPVSFNPGEDFPVFQRAFYAAQALGIEAKTHDAVFKAIHSPDGQLATYDIASARMKDPLPDINDIAKFYTQYGVKPADFIATADSFAVNIRMKRADALVQAYGVTGTPTMVVNGKWRADLISAGTPERLVQIVDYLIARESAAKP